MAASDSVDMAKRAVMRGMWCAEVDMAKRAVSSRRFRRNSRKKKKKKKKKGRFGDCDMWRKKMTGVQRERERRL
ncbi:conserved hypothetical protein [Ricinus communis]|uniref:Uncharacterized protein n=1 Tax=Ricinus communis TaxID=3988 RepID=B9SLE1_RICCO|nr:conserved hypothetical protein [Ricinus communis]